MTVSGSQERGTEMADQYSILTFSDGGTDRKTLGREEAGRLFETLKITRDADLCSDIIPLLGRTTAGHGLFFMNYACGKYAGEAGRDEAFLPVYGVREKEADGEKDYLQICFCNEDDLYGTGFTEHVFGTEYLSAEEVQKLREAKLKNRMQAQPRKIDCTIAADDQEDVCRIVEQLWSIQEENPSAKLLVITGEDPMRAQRLMKGVSLMLPHRLRLAAGFLTNADQQDLKRIAAGLPISLITAAQVPETLPEETGKARIQVLDLAQADHYSYQEKRMRLLRQMAYNMDRILTGCLSLAEEDVLEKHEGKESSFLYYREIIERTFDPALYWWNRTDFADIEALKALYDKQRKLMEDENTAEQAMNAFYSQILPESDFARQALEILGNEEYPDREELLTFLREDLKAAPWLDASLEIMRSIRDHAASHEKAALERQSTELNETITAQMEQERIVQNDVIEGWQKKLRELEETSRRQLAEADTRIADLDGRLTAATREGQVLTAQAAEKDSLIAQLSTRTMDDQMMLSDMTERLRESGTLEIEEVQKAASEREAELQKQIEETKNAAEQEIAEAGKKLEKAAKGKKTAVMLAVLFGLLGAAGIGGAGYGLFQAGSMQKNVQALQNEVLDREADLEALQVENETLQGQVVSLQAENDELSAENAALGAELEAMKAEQEPKETETEMKTEEAETETEVPELPAGPEISAERSDGTVTILVDGTALPLN